MANAPATEVIITIQFETPLVSLSALEIADLYNEFSMDFSEYEQVQPAGPMLHTLTQLDGSEPVDYSIPTMPRLKFSQAGDSRILLVQLDRLTYGWRRTKPLEEAGDYPGFEVILKEFLLVWARAKNWARVKVGAELRPRLAEIAYVNAFLTQTPDGHHIRLSDIYCLFAKTAKPMKVFGYSHTWNEKLDNLDGILIVAINGPAITPSSVPATMLTLTGTFKLSDADKLESELLQLRERIGQSFERTVHQESRP